MLNKTPLNKINPKSDNRRWPLLWRTIFLLTLFVVLSQIVLYIWIQRSVKGHFEEMDAEIITHATFNWRQRLADFEPQTANAILLDATNSYMANEANHLHASWLDYDLKTVITDKQGRLLSVEPSDFTSELNSSFNLLTLQQNNGQQQFITQINDRNYRAIIIENEQNLALIALPIDVHHQYLSQFNRKLSLILFAITLLLVSIAALSVYWGFAPLSTIVQKMKGISAERLGERVIVSDMPLELRPLAESYNLMMINLENNFASLSRFSDNIAHELRTPIATLSTQTQVMLNRPREKAEYIEQLHQQHDTLEQLSAMINNMLLLAKTQKGLSDSQITRVDTENLINKLLDYFEMIAEDRAITFVRSGDFEAVLGDKGLLQRLFANLLSNAIYYAASNSVITISATTIITKGTDNAKSTLATDPNHSLEQSWLKITISNRLEKPLEQSEADKLI